MIPDDRASRFGEAYRENGEIVVTFNPRLTEGEWKYLMYCQELALSIKKDKLEEKEKEILEKLKAKKEKESVKDAKKKKDEADKLEKLKNENQLKED